VNKMKAEEKLIKDWLTRKLNKEKDNFNLQDRVTEMITIVSEL